MHYTRIYSDKNGDSHFETVEMSLTDEGPLGSMSQVFHARAVQFREHNTDFYWDFHNPPAKQFVIMLGGEVEITTSLGEKRKFANGDILLLDDVDGKGHRTENIWKAKRKSIFIQL